MTDHLEWISEKWPDLETRYRVRSVLYDEQSDFQHMQLVDTYEYGRMLLLDGIVQTTERDEFIYHEMMVHVPVLSHPDPKKVLIIGGGDGGILREVLRYDYIGKATIVEIDPQVIKFCKEHLPSISKGAFDDSRVDLIINDGAEYVNETDEKYDVIIVDSPDPIGPARILFSEKFYLDIHKILTPQGIMVRQTGSLELQGNEQKEANSILKNIFHYNAFYVYTVPTYVGGLFSTVFCSDTVNPLEIRNEELKRKLEQASIETLYYNPGIHVGAFHVPEFMKERLQ